MTTRKMDSVSPIEALLVPGSLETEAFMWIPSRCRGRLKTELPVNATEPESYYLFPCTDTELLTEFMAKDVERRL